MNKIFWPCYLHDPVCVRHQGAPRRRSNRRWHDGATAGQTGGAESTGVGGAGVTVRSPAVTPRAIRARTRPAPCPSAASSLISTATW
jgi:hypothetical protein